MRVDRSGESKTGDRDGVQSRIAKVFPSHFESVDGDPGGQPRGLVGLLVEVLGVAATAGRVLEVGGADVVTYRQMMAGKTPLEQQATWAQHLQRVHGISDPQEAAMHQRNVERTCAQVMPGGMR